VIAIADLATCEIHLVNVHLRTRLETIGGCGEGPGELSFTSGIGVLDDSIFALDANRQQVQVFGPDGEEVRRYRYADLEPPGIGTLEWGTVISSEAALATRFAFGRDTILYPAWQTPIGIVRTVGTSGLRFEPSRIRIAAASELTAIRSGGVLHAVRVCASEGFQPGVRGYAVATQPFAFETVVLDASLTPVVRTHTKVDWVTPARDSTRSDGPWILGARRWYVICGEDAYAVAMRTFVGRDERTADTHGRLEIRSYDGSLVASRNWGEADTNEFTSLGSPKALFGDTLVTLRIDQNGWQRVALWEVTP
jgi:hypothetical protein